MRINTILLLLLTVSVSTLLSAQNTFSLQEAMDYASANSVETRLSAIAQEDARQRIKETTSIGLPKIDGSLNYTHNYKIPVIIIPDFMNPTQTQQLEFGLPQNATASVGLQTLLLDGQFFYGLRAARTYKSLVNAQSMATDRGVRYQVAKAYLGAWVIEENLEIVQKNIVNLEGTLSETKAIYENGFAEQLDVDRLELSLRSLRTEYENLSRMTQVALNNLKFLMNYPIADAIKLEENLDRLLLESKSEEIDFDVSPDVTERAEYIVFDNSLAINEINVKRLKAGYWPNLTGFLNYQANLSRNKLFNSEEVGFIGAGAVGLQLNVPIFDGFLKKAQIQRAKLDLEEIRTQRDQFTQAAYTEAYNARIQLYNARQNLISNEESLDLANRIYDITQIKYTEGVGSSVETTQAERELYAIQAQLLESQFNLINAKIDLDNAIGNL